MEGHLLSTHQARLGSTGLSRWQLAPAWTMRFRTCNGTLDEGHHARPAVDLFLLVLFYNQDFITQIPGKGMILRELITSQL